MTKKLDIDTPEVVAYEFDQKITEEEVERIHDDIRKALAENETVRLFADCRHLESMDPSAVIEDLKLAPEYISEIERFAVIGDNKWLEFLSKAGDKLTQGETRYFSPDEFNKARQWIQAH